MNVRDADERTLILLTPRNRILQLHGSIGHYITLGMALFKSFLSTPAWLPSGWGSDSEGTAARRAGVERDETETGGAETDSAFKRQESKVIQMLTSRTGRWHWVPATEPATRAEKIWQGLPPENRFSAAHGYWLLPRRAART